MAQDRNVKNGQALILHNKEIGFVRAWAAEDHSGVAGGSALFRVNVNSPQLPGIAEAIINTNQWDVYLEDDPVVLKKISDTYVKLASVR